MSALVELESVGLTYATGSGAVSALSDVSFSIEAGELVAVVGRSGSGKSSLLNLMTGIDHPTTGRVRVAGTEVHTLAEGPLARWRGSHVGIVFQFFQLIPTLSTLENVLLPMEFVGKFDRRERRERALALLEQVGIADHRDKLPGTLSGGEQQRAALARALANDPPLLVADEPTGNLDTKNADRVNRLLAGLSEAGKTVVVVTHERQPSVNFHRVLELSDGRLLTPIGGHR